MVAYANVSNRPGYDSCPAHEYCDDPQTLSAKIHLLAELVRKSRHCVAYTGAGISTASGISDYASQGLQSMAVALQPKVRSHFDAGPTLAHRVLTAMYNAGHLKHWVQQNHDGLPQKAGYPQHALNEIHGSWYDPSNPVVKMQGELRPDLFNRLVEWEQRTDLCLAIGTSLAGMNADRMARTPAQKAAEQQDGVIGTVIISLQQTPMDGLASLRIFGPIEEVMALLAEELRLTASVPLDFTAAAGDDVFTIPYGSNGQRLRPDSSPSMHSGPAKCGANSCTNLQHSSQPCSDPGLQSPILQSGHDNPSISLLDLRPESLVRITMGPYTGDEGEVIGKSRQGHYKIRFMHTVKGSWKAPVEHVLGRWMVEEALQGKLDSFPVVSLQQRVDPDAEAKRLANFIKANPPAPRTCLNNP